MVDVNYVEELEINCPYCGEFFSIVVECFVGNQSYTEDCYVCCRPVGLFMKIGEEGNVSVEARRENE